MIDCLKSCSCGCNQSVCGCHDEERGFTAAQRD